MAPQFVNTIINFMSELPGKIWNAIVGAVSNVSNWGSQLLSAGINAAQNLVNGIWNEISKIPGQMLEIGTNLVQGLWNGISNATSWVLDKIKGFGESILNGIKSFFGIASPSKLFEEQIGKNLALGVGEGFEETMKNVSKQMEMAIPTDFDTSLNTAINYANPSEELVTNKSRRFASDALSEGVTSRKKELELLEKIWSETQDLNETLYGKFVGALVNGVSISVDNRELARLIRRYA